MKNKQTILLFIKMPPPITGATLINKRVYESLFLRSAFHLRVIPISYSKNLDDMGKWQIGKFLRICKVYFKLFNELIFHRSEFVYFQISPLKFAFIRDFLYSLIMKLFRIKIVYHIHGQGIKKASENKIIKKMYKFVFNKAEIICLSNLLIYDLKGVFTGKIHIVNNGIIDLNPEKQFRIENSNEKSIRLLFLSNLIISKGIFVFIDVIEGLREKNISFEVNIVGAGGTLSAENLEKIITKKGLSNCVKYWGPQYGDKKKNILKNSDVLIFPTMNDAFPSVIIEAMQFGLPVISTYEGAIPDIVDDNKTGFLVIKNNSKQIIERIIELNNNRELLCKLGNAGRKKYETKYLFSIFEKNMKKVFDSVLNN